MGARLRVAAVALATSAPSLATGILIAPAPPRRYHRRHGRVRDRARVRGLLLQRAVVRAVCHLLLRLHRVVQQGDSGPDNTQVICGECA